MEYWDPFSVCGDSIIEEAPQKGSDLHPPSGGNRGDTKEWASTRIRKKDFDAIVDTLEGHIHEYKPWNRAPNTLPDLSWHQPSCSFESWHHKHVRVELSQGIVYIILNNPEDDNRLSSQVMAGLCDAILLLHAREDIRMAVFMGEGRLFCGGGHPSGNTVDCFNASGLPRSVVQSREELRKRALASGAFPDGDVDMARVLQAKMWHTLFRVPQFTVCLLNGSVLGDGFGFLACCDTVVAARHVFVNIPEVKEGFVNSLILPYLVAKIGISNAKCMLCSAENVSAEKATRIGIVQEVVETLEAGHNKICELAQILTGCGPHSVKTAKRLVAGVAGRQITEGVMFYTGALLALVTISDEAKHGMIAVQARTLKPWEEKPITPLYGEAPQ